MWYELGCAAGYLGVPFGFTALGFLAACALLFGGACVALGLFFRLACLALAATMAVAAIWKYYPFGGLEAAAHPVTLLAVFLGLFLTGPGKWSVDAQLG